MTTLVDSLLTPTQAGLVLESAGNEKVWLVGGAVRDHFLDHRHPDLDFVVSQDAAGLARAVADSLEVPYFVLDEPRDAARVVMRDGRTLDFVRLRGGSIEQDLRQRDFTINALAVRLDEPSQLIDELGGLQDLRDKLLRGCSPTSIRDDPLRSLRAVRIATALLLRIEKQTTDQIRESAPRLKDTSAERIRDELVRMLKPEVVAISMRLMARLGLLSAVLPEVGRMPPKQMDQTLQVTDWLARVLGALDESFREERASNLVLAEISLRLGRFREDLSAHLGRRLRGGTHVEQLLILAALFHDLPDSEAAAKLQSRCQALRFSRKEASRAANILRNLRGIEGTESRLGRHRYFRTAREAGVDAALLSLAVAQNQTPGQPAWRRKVSAIRNLLEAWFDRYEELIQPPALLTGDELAEMLQLTPGPILGELLEQISEAQVQEAIQSKEEALEFARQQLMESERDEIRERSR